MLKADKLTMEYAKPLFEEISFILGNNEKVGLVGLNGCGKTTLLKIITGEEQPLGGEVHAVNERIAYLPQEFKLGNKEEDFLGEYLESLIADVHSEMWRVEKLLNQLEFGEIDEFQVLKTLSPGQKMKLYLTKLLLDDPTILLLDEPTNHLDIRGITVFESFLKRFQGICIIISHDRTFLNNITDHIFEIDENRLNVYVGNYESHLEQKEFNIQERAKEVRMQEKKRMKFVQMEALIKKQGGGRKQSKALGAVRKRMEREVLRDEKTLYQEKKLKNLTIDGHVHDRKKILEIENVSFSYDQNSTLLEDVNLEIYGSEKIWLLGPNGTGKTTLIKMLTGEITPDTGSVSWGANLNWTYFAQDQIQREIDETVQDYFFRLTNVAWNQSYGVLEKFLFDKELQNYQVKRLSPGQKARLTFAIFAQNKYECLILDEPTNHLDIQTKEAIETALRDYSGAIILVSHDRYFAEQIEPSRVMTIKDRKLVDQG